MLAEDDHKLLSYLKSEDLSRKRVALLCLLHFHPVYPKGIVREAADYLVNGDDLGIRSLCRQYLGTSHNEEITSILRDCARKLATRRARPGDAIIVKCILRSMDLVGDGPRPYADTARMAEEILARLRSGSDRTDSRFACPRCSDTCPMFLETSRPE